MSIGTRIATTVGIVRACVAGVRAGLRRSAANTARARERADSSFTMNIPPVVTLPPTGQLHTLSSSQQMMFAAMAQLGITTDATTARSGADITTTVLRRFSMGATTVPYDLGSMTTCGLLNCHRPPQAGGSFPTLYYLSDATSAIATTLHQALPGTRH